MVRLETGACWIDAIALLSEEPGADDARSALAELCKGELLEELDGVSRAFDQWLLGKRTGFAESLRKLLEGKLQQADDPARSRANARKSRAG